MIRVIVDNKDFNIAEEIDLIKHKSIGAIASFVGLVRDFADKPLISLEIECYQAMAQKQLTDIANKANKRWGLENITIYHRFGKLSPSQQIVLVITTAKHRKEAFNGCEFIMDFLKTDAPFWKKEITKDKQKWVNSREEDYLIKQKWDKS